jgi:hypothetical protein
MRALLEHCTLPLTDPDVLMQLVIPTISAPNSSHCHTFFTFTNAAPYLCSRRESVQAQRKELI